MFQELLVRLNNLPPVVILLFATLDLVLKAICLWRSARRGQKWWFVALIIVNSAGILPLIYLAFFDKESSRQVTKRS